MTDRVRLLKNALRHAPGPKLTIRQSRGSMCFRVNIDAEKYAPFSKEQRAILERIGIISEHIHPRTSQTSITNTEADMLLGLRKKEPVCSSCGYVWRTEEEARQCGLSH